MHVETSLSYKSLLLNIRRSGEGVADRERNEPEQPLASGDNRGHEVNVWPLGGFYNRTSPIPAVSLSEWGGSLVKPLKTAIDSSGGRGRVRHGDLGQIGRVDARGLRAETRLPSQRPPS